MGGPNKIDPKTGTIVYEGPSVLTKANREDMPFRTDAYLPTDERGHIQASALGGKNGTDNVVPQSADLNHEGYYSMEQGEMAALNKGSTIHSEKIAYVSNQPGNRPDAFMVNDAVTYPDGQTQGIHFSFTNITNGEHESFNEASLTHAADMFDAQPNPGDGLRDSMSATEYTTLMEETDPSLPDISDSYDEQISVGGPEEAEADAEGADAGGTDDGADISSDED